MRRLFYGALLCCLASVCWVGIALCLLDAQFLWTALYPLWSLACFAGVWLAVRWAVGWMPGSAPRARCALDAACGWVSVLIGGVWMLLTIAYIAFGLLMYSGML